MNSLSDQSSGAMPRRLLLVRHGLPDYRFGKAGDELPGPPLSPTGLVQAGQAAAVVRPLRPTVIHTSPLARTRQTAEKIAARLGIPVQVATGLREWHRTERLYDVTARLTHWLVRWLHSGARCAVAVSHASPMLAILRSALYLPQVRWYQPRNPHLLELSSGDRFEVSMASVFELVFDPDTVTARCLFHPAPRIMSMHNGQPLERLPRPVHGHGERACVRRPNRLRLIGYRACS